MASIWGFARSSKLINAACSISSISAAARQAGQASTSEAHSCSTRLLSLLLAGSQSRQLASSAAVIPLALQTHALEGRLHLKQPSLITECRASHVHTKTDSLLHNSRRLADDREQTESSHFHEFSQRRTAFGLPNLNGDSSKKYTERRLIG